MTTLHIYTVHIKPQDAAPHETAEFVREGFSLWAFVFIWGWAFYHRLWWAGVGLLALEGIFSIAIAQTLLPKASAMVLKLGVQLLFGFFAHDLLRHHLRRQGHVMADIVTGDSDLTAHQRFFERWLHSTAKPTKAQAG